MTQLTEALAILQQAKDEKNAKRRKPRTIRKVTGCVLHSTVSRGICDDLGDILWSSEDEYNKTRPRWHRRVYGDGRLT